MQQHTGGAVGAGLVLVVLPSTALFFGTKYLTTWPIVGLPLVAIFGIMILFGALALTSTLFARLHLDDRNQALALPEGSIRAAVTLALIVLFAIIAILLNEGSPKTFEIPQLSKEQRDALLRDMPQRFVASTCVSQGSDGKGSPKSEPCGDNATYVVQMTAPPDPSRQDLAKQLLTLIGTLMTAVVSFYFGSRTAQQSPSPQATSDPSVAQDAGHEHTPTANPTSDEDLPAASGGVAS